MKRGDFLSVDDLTTEQVYSLLDRALRLKEHRQIRHDLRGKSIALVFQKPSLRTRASFDVGMTELGGHALYLGPDEIGLGKRESIPDVARVLSQYVHGIVARTFRHSDVCRLAEYASVPVVNALSDWDHPCQAMADLLTMQERFGSRLAGLRVTYVGDGNNVARGLAFAAAKVGLKLVLASPPGYACDANLVARADSRARDMGGSVCLVDDPRAAAEGAAVLYTDVWTSMGQEQETEERRRVFGRFRIDAELVSLAHPSAIVMHDLPAHRGEEITDDVLDGPHSVVFQQAGNRMYAQNAVLLWLLSDADGGRP
jgi:ornithine carbamoyltransferase